MIATNRFDPTADHVLLELRERGADVVRLNTEDVPSDAGIVLGIDQGGVDGRLEFGGRSVRLGDIRSVWYRRPAPPEPSDRLVDPADRRFASEESEEALFGLWRVLEGVWVSHPDALEAASYKPAQLRAASILDLEVPRTLITNEPEDALRFVEGLDGRAVVKPLRSGLLRKTDEYEEVIFTNPIREEDVLDGMQAVSLCPSLLQEYVEKDVEVRVTVVGKEVFAAEIRSQVTPGAEHDWRRVSAVDVEHAPHELPTRVVAGCSKLVQRLGLNFGAIDLIRTPDGRYVFLEINPNGQWLWVETLTGLRITESLVRLLSGEAEGLQ